MRRRGPYALINDGGERVTLAEYSTKELTKELAKREGVQTAMVEPYENVSINLNGPAIVVINVD
ncbi:BC1881 family protein [Paenibacillus sp. 1011MAR3C5]|nr:BC1881 family protein [Paenibacillus sp. 1011MAR3C5]